MNDSSLSCYGEQVTPEGLKKLLVHVFETNFEKQDKEDKVGTPICIWGTHGIGKTQIAEAFARERGWLQRYIAPAQFEEMGELHGMPVIHDPTPNEFGKPNFSGDEITVYLPPDWVPNKDKHPGPGILLLDDFNRADDRILRGIMQLLQNFELQSWQLPKQWQIVATANPEGGDYSVTPLDDAMLTRMLHVTLSFCPKDWAIWATSAGVDPRGIDFVLAYYYPKGKQGGQIGKRTTPRTLVQFFEQIKAIKDLQAEEELVRMLGHACLDDSTVAAFMVFVQDDLTRLISPDEILDAPSFPEVEKKLRELGRSEDGSLRSDRLWTICTRLSIMLTSEGYALGANHRQNLAAFLKSEHIPPDLRAGLAMELSTQASDEVREVMRGDPQLTNTVLDVH